MASDLDRHILVITEPTLKLDPMVYDSGKEEEPEGVKISKENGLLTPAVRINGIDLQQYDINTLSINMSGFIPELSIAFMDRENYFKGDSIPRDGDVVSIRIASRQTDVFKDIRMDFDIIRCSTSAAPDGGDNSQSLPGGQYRISGRLRVPKLYAEESKGYGKKTSLDHLEAIATELKLGFATNIDKTDDEMSRFCPYIPKARFIQDIVKHGYIDDESFVVCKIDPYYNLNYVDLNKVFNSKNDLELSYFSKMQEDFNKNPGDDDKANKIKGPLLITNHPEYQASPKFFESFKVINESGEKTAQMGYKIKMQYFENDSDEGLVSFDIESMASKKMSDIEEPLRGRRKEGGGKEEETRYKDEVKQKYVGRIDADKTHGNMNINHYFAAIQNKMNYNESTKIKMEVTLDQINPSIYMYMKIPVFVVAYNDTEVARLKSLKENKKEKGFSTVGEEYGEDFEAENEGKIAMDEFHTGYYIVEDIKYMYDSETGAGIQQKITLLRREWPSKLNVINAESMASQSPPAPPPPAPPPAPAAAPAPAPAATPDPEPPKPEPVFTLDLEYLKERQGIGSWFEFIEFLQWKADDKTLVTETPKIKVVFTGPSTYEVDAEVFMETQKRESRRFDKTDYNAKFTVPKSTFAGKEGKYDVDVILTYKEQTVKEIAKFEFRPWKAGQSFGVGGSRIGKNYYTWETISGQEPGTYIGKYTLKAEATKGESPRSGRIEGTDVRDVIKRAEDAATAEGMNA
jgi:hypothetical protein